MDKVELLCYRDDGASLLGFWMFRKTGSGSGVIIAEIQVARTDGYGVDVDDTITLPVIDNENYYYCVEINLDPNDDPMDCYVHGVKIYWH